MDYTLNIKGRLMELGTPKVMGIINVTPDSFYAESRKQTAEAIANSVARMADEGATFIDVGACSTRPGSTPVSEAEEMERLRPALSVIAQSTARPQVVLSVDTFRPDVARMAVEEFGADIINDVKATATPNSQSSAQRHQETLRLRRTLNSQTTEMYRMVARLKVPYVLMSSEPTVHDTLLFFAEQVQMLRDFGQKDIILDPGFGFGKTMEQNYEILSQLEQLQVMELPLMVALSRKSMICKLLNVAPEEALNGTTVIHTISLMKGASILRVHDVKAAVECCEIIKKLKN